MASFLSFDTIWKPRLQSAKLSRALGFSTEGYHFRVTRSMVGYDHTTAAPEPKPRRLRP